ncbi:MAG: hypothetical protein JJU12_03175 [Chlamydiales bacterium]|nr:hypothetical protein [Chlamydiales bacterium]
MVPEKGGKGGVYYLQDKNGRRRFVLKPLDESNLAVNNGKKNGSICFESGEGAPANGVHIYESVQNAELAYKVAEFLGFSEITPESEVMILEDDRFHDNLHHLLGEKTPKEKVVLVQRYVEGCWDIGTLLCDKTKMQEEEIKNLMKNEEGIKKLESLKEEYMPKDFDQDLYEKLAIFLIVIGEKDGNAGNFIANKEEPKKGEKRTIVKIDNSACFAENNEDIATGLEWFTHNYEQQLSEKTKDLIKNLATKESVEQIKKMMESRGKSAESIKAFEKRIENLEFNSLMCDTPADFDLVFTD